MWCLKSKSRLWQQAWFKDNQMNIKYVAFSVLVLLLTGCFAEDSPAPGCVERGLIMGGCFGKTAIVDLQVEPEIDCLEIEANNCNGGVLEIYHTCNDVLVLDGIEIQPLDRTSLDVMLGPDGDYVLVEVHSNFSELVPDEDLQIVIDGSLGTQEISISFAKTQPLCD